MHAFAVIFVLCIAMGAGYMLWKRREKRGKAILTQTQWARQGVLVGGNVSASESRLYSLDNKLKR